ncbi:MAG: inositol monophosphatase family protein [Leptospirillia bacterium]
MPSDSMIQPAFNLTAAREVAVAAARCAGGIQRDGYHREVKVTHKGDIDLLTEIDTACERTVVEAILSAFPGHRILAEEGGELGADESPFRWVIDPLDGTTNYAHRFPFFCVSIGLEMDGEVALGVVFAPMMGPEGELFIAERGRGASLNGKPISVSGTSELMQSMLVTGFAYNVHSAARDNLDHFADVTRTVQATRRTGSAALDLCYVAAGRTDGFWELNLKPWDVAAGRFILSEAGGAVSRFDGSPHALDDDEILATNGRIHQPMIELLGRWSH